MHNLNETTQYKKELRGRLLETAMREFTTKGIKAVKMDDIAAQLGISKRTMYEIYEKKEDLLLEGIIKRGEEDDRRFAAFLATGKRSTMDILIEFFHQQMKSVENVCPQFYADLHKYQKVIDHIARKHEEHDERGMEFFKRGVKEGYFRDDFDYDFLQIISRQIMEYVMDKQLYKKYGTQRMLRNLIMLFVRGFTTQKGIQELDRALEMYK